jgi:hypothetical protein
MDPTSDGYLKLLNVFWGTRIIFKTSRYGETKAQKIGIIWKAHQQNVIPVLLVLVC